MRALLLFLLVGACLATVSSAVVESVSMEVEVVFYDAGTHAALGPGKPVRGHVQVSGPDAVRFSSPPPVFASVSEFIAMHVEGAHSGDVITTPVQTHGLARWEKTLELPRSRGPFSIHHSVPTLDFERLYGVPQLGLQFQDMKATDLSLRVMGFSETVVWYDTLVVDGQRVVIRPAGWEAVALADYDRFWLFPSPAENSTFRLSCKTGVFPELETLGSYRVEKLGLASVTLSHSTFSAPELVGRPVYARITILDDQSTPPDESKKNLQEEATGTLEELEGLT